jgi:RND superfamily putative drug exporter
MDFWSFIVRRKWIIFSIWLIFIALMSISALNYTKFISYNQENNLPSNSDSVIAQNILKNLNNDSLILIVNLNPMNLNSSEVFMLQRELVNLPYIYRVDSPFSEYASFLGNVLGNETMGINLVKEYGLKGIPSFILYRFVSNDNSSFLMIITLNVSSDYHLSNGETPSQYLFPTIEHIVSKYFNSYYITGNGVIQYEIQQLTSQSGFAFGLIFIVLAIAVGLTLYTYKASLLSLVFASFSTLIGYTSIFLSGLLIGRIDYVVNYTLTAVLLGITTDYLVFILGRFREELREGKDVRRAVIDASRRAGKAVLVSGLTVGISLSTFSLIPGFLSWGVVLVISILIAVLLMVTFLPSLMAIAGNKLFSKKGLGKIVDKSSLFYKTSLFSIERSYLVVAIILALAIPSIFMFFNLPTTYDFSSGLPSNLEGVKALNFLYQHFGSNLYPVFVIVNGSGRNLENTSEFLISIHGFSKGFGPYLLGNEVVQNNISRYRAGEYYYYIIYLNYSPYSREALNAVQQLREKGFIVGGITSSVIDQENINSFYYPLLEVLITLTVALILGISFKSIKYPLISISGILISISWTTSIIYFIFRVLLNQEIIYLIPVILFVILMSLGNDYSVFIISRVEEVIDEGLETGVPRAFSRTGKIVTSLGIILALSLGVLALIPVAFLQQLGLAFLVSLFIDTFIIRNFYFPAMIKLLRRVR